VGPLAAIQPTPEGHFLTNTELEPLMSIPCLEARQKDPSIRCVNGSISRSTGLGSLYFGDGNAGIYPNYKDKVCYSNGEYFCDPHRLLSVEERANITGLLRTLRENNPVVCGNLLKDPVDPWHYQPFYLGVIVAQNWPAAQLGPTSMQEFGQVVAADWNMNVLYTGSPQPYLRCPNTAMLIVVPDSRRAFLSSASCEFLCQGRGGPEVVMATLVNLDSKGVAAAVRAGMEEVYHVVSKTASQSSTIVTTKEDKVGISILWTTGANVSTLVQRIVFGVAVACLALSLCLGAAVVVLAPSVLTKLRK